MLDVNLLGVTNTAQAVLGSMTERGFGRIVAVASTAGLKGYPYVSAYCAAKHAVIGFVRALAFETARNGRHGQCGLPGLHRYRPRFREPRRASWRRPTERATRRWPNS